MIARRSLSVIPPHAAISSIDRQHPSHRRVSALIWQMSMQGLSMRADGSFVAVKLLRGCYT